uniref:Neutrophil cytosol factor 4-like n=1 Tax=Sinocyclocheilus grahami TaxID=75366 RepID=A0A672NYR2_SINGR
SMSLPQQLRDESDFDQLPDNIPVTATIADIEEKKGFIVYYRFVIEVKAKGNSKYLIYRRYRQFLTLHQSLELKYSAEAQPGYYTCQLPTLPGLNFLAIKFSFRFVSLSLCLSCTRKLRENVVETTSSSVIHLKFTMLSFLSFSLTRKTVKPKTDLLSAPRAEAVFDFSSSGRLELSLKAGDVIFLLRRVNADWLEGTVRDKTGIIPESFVNIIKPLPESDSDEEGGAFKSGNRAPSSYSCLRCYLLQPEGIGTRDICVEEDLSIQPSYEDLLSRMRDVFQVEAIALNYRDPEGDLIRILDDEDVTLMVQESKQTGSKVKRPVNQFPWELLVTHAKDLSVYNTEY